LTFCQVIIRIYCHERPGTPPEGRAYPADAKTAKDEALSLEYANAPRYAKSRELYKAACEVIRAGQQHGARRLVGWIPSLFVAEGQGSPLGMSTATSISTTCWGSGP